MAATGNVRVKVVPDYTPLIDAMMVLANALGDMANAADRARFALETLEREQAEEVT